MMSWISGIGQVLGACLKRRSGLSWAVLVVAAPLISGCGRSDSGRVVPPRPVSLGAWRLELAVAEAAYGRLKDTDSALEVVRKLLEFSGFCEGNQELVRVQVDSLRRAVTVLDELGPGVPLIGIGHVIPGDYGRHYPKLLFDCLVALSDVEPASGPRLALALRALEVARSSELGTRDQMRALLEVAQAAGEDDDWVLGEASLKQGIEIGEARARVQGAAITEDESFLLGILYGHLARYEYSCRENRHLAIYFGECAVAYDLVADSSFNSVIHLHRLHRLGVLENRWADAFEYARLGLQQSMLARIDYSNKSEILNESFEYFLQASGSGDLYSGAPSE